MLKLFCLLLLFIGSCTMLASIILYTKTIKSYTNYLTSYKSTVVNRHTAILVMMLFFLVGYVATIFYMARLDVVEMSMLLIATIFFFGAVFCFSVVYVMSEFLTRLKQNALELREALDKSEKANLALTASMDALEHAQSQLVFSEKMSALGKLTAGISHEINSPIGVIKASAGSLQTAFTERFTDFFMNIRKLPDEDFQEFVHYTEAAFANNKKFVSTSEQRALKRKAAQTLANVDGYNDTILDLLVDCSLLDADSIASVTPKLAAKTFELVLRSVNKTVSIMVYIDNIVISTERMSKIVSSLKGFSHISIENKKASFNVVSGIETVLSINANQLKYDIEVTTDFEAVPNIVGYEDELNQVWNNLIQNAVYAMHERKNSPFEERQPNKLAVTVKNTNDRRIAIAITDNGEGVSPDKMANIFEPFYTTKPTGIGSGLGLSISKQIIDKHEGEIHVASTKGYGTTFTITLPVT